METPPCEAAGMMEIVVLCLLGGGFIPLSGLSKGRREKGTWSAAEAGKRLKAASRCAARRCACMRSFAHFFAQAVP